jgi:large subunit ribosomal protein L21
MSRRVALPTAAKACCDVVLPLTQNAPLFATIMLNTFQYKVCEGDVIMTHRMRADMGEQILAKRVVMVGGPKFTAIGRPFLENCSVTLEVEEHKRMREMIHLTAPQRWRLFFWKPNEPPATVLRVLKIHYEPVVVGRLHKGEGRLMTDEEIAAETPNAAPDTTWADILEPSK